MILENLGWNDFFNEAFSSVKTEGLKPGRVVWQGAYNYRVQCEDMEIDAKPAGKLKSACLPAVGDWVAVRPEKGGNNGTIFALLPRKSVFSRNAPGRPVQELEWAKRFLEVSCMTYKMIRREGGTMAIGTDYGGESLIRVLGGSAIELELLVKYCDFTPMEAIVAATRNSAMACFMEDKTGTLEPGKFADIIILDGDPSVDISVLQDRNKIKTVMLEGRVEIER